MCRSMPSATMRSERDSCVSSPVFEYDCALDDIDHRNEAQEGRSCSICATIACFGDRLAKSGSRRASPCRAAFIVAPRFLRIFAPRASSLADFNRRQPDYASLG